MTKPIRVLVVGQTPPPFHGQSMMIQELVHARFEDFEVVHVRMSFSRELDEVGRFRLSKVRSLLGLIVKIIYAKMSERPSVLYYPPAGPNLVPILRDILILGSTRWMFRSTVFHIHAGGLAEFRADLPLWVRPLFDFVYREPDVCIRLGPSTPEDCSGLGAKTSLIIPNGVPDAGDPIPARSGSGSPEILFVGAIRESKGVLVLLAAAQLLVERGVDFRIRLVGRFTSRDFATRMTSEIASQDLATYVTVLGELTGDLKKQAFREADIFCLPSHYESEAQPVVLIEAMQVGLPIVASDWRGIPDLVVNDVNGFLIAPKDPEALAGRLETLIGDPALRARLGKGSRERYESDFSIEKHLKNLELAFQLAIRKNLSEEPRAQGSEPRASEDHESEL